MDRELPRRRSLRGSALVKGRGLFTSRPAACTIHPAPPGSGIAFRRTDLPGAPRIPATLAHLCPPGAPADLPAPARSRCTCLGDEPGARALTVEHVLSALSGLGVRDAEIDLDGPEVPIGDGSAAPFTDALLAAGLEHSAILDEPVVLRAPVRVQDGPAWIEARPAQEMGVEYRLDYGPESPIPPQVAAWEGGAHEYAARIAPARTFCLEAEARAMRAAGLFEGLSPRDLLVVGPDGPIENSWRFADEAARHKVLDVLGDLSLLGRPVLARVVAVRSGHALNHALARAIAAQQSAR